MGFEDYNPVVMDHFLNPRNTGELKEPDAAAFVENKACGDMVKLTMRVRDGIITEARTQTFGCAAAIAAASALTELVIGRTTAAALALTDLDVVERLGGLPAHKAKCSLVTKDVLQEALAGFAAKAG